MRERMTLEPMAIVVIGALAGGVVNGLTGFGTALTAMGLWLYVLPPTAASSLAIVCSLFSQLQTFPMIWPSIRWRDVLPFVVPGVFGVPLGTLLLPYIDPKFFKLGIGFLLIAYPAYVLLCRGEIKSDFGGRPADGVVGFAGGILGGLTGLSGALPVVWTDIRGWTKEGRRGVLQAFNLSILSLALASHAASGLLSRQVGLDVAIALPATVAGVWAGAYGYLRLPDRGYQRIVMLMLLAAGVGLVWATW
jgi:uncharacterized protein